MKNILSLIAILTFSTSSLFAQQIGDGFAPIITDFSAPLKSGSYNGLNHLGGVPDNNHPWQHLFTIRHPSPGNNHQLQIASSFAVNDRLFFRKIATDLVYAQNNAWNEIATRGSNTFNGNQIINGDQDVRGKISTPEIAFRNADGGDNSDPYRLRKVKGSENNNWLELQLNDDPNESFRIYGNSCDGFACGEYSNNLYHSFDAQGNVFHKGNIGIGTTDPKNKLSVNGTIWAKEVKVSLIDAADWVFDKNYKLKPLAEVEKYINENKHLPEVPSAQEFRQNDMNVSQMSNLLLQKVEELTLYAIEQNKELARLKAENASYKSLIERVLIIEKKLTK